MFNAARAAHADTLAAKTGRELRAKMGWKQAQNLDEAKIILRKDRSAAYEF